MDIADINLNSTQTVSDKAELITEDKSSKQNKNTEQLPLQTAKKLLSSNKFVPADNSVSFRIIVVSGVVFALSVTVALILSIYLGPPQIGATGAVATDVQECSDIGLQILQNGGNAVDATVASTLCLGVVNPQSSGLGGGGFMLVHDHKVDKSWVYDFREVAPAAATPDMFGTDETLLYSSGLSVGVPGELKGLAVAHKAHGKLRWADIVKPVAELARKGFNVTKHLENTLINHVKVTDMSPKMRQMFSLDGRPLKYGDKMKRPDLGDVLDIIARDPDSIYTGILAEDIVQAVKNDKNYSGIMTLNDLRDYKVVQRDVIKTSFKGGNVTTLPPPSSGPLLLLMLNIMEGFNWTETDVSNPKTYHQMIEALKFGYARHGDLGDPAYDKTTIDNNTLHIISKGLANILRNKIDNETHSQEYYGANYNLDHNAGTSHLSVVDASELMVSLTTTVNEWFGSKIMTDRGIILNNEMADFTIPNIKSMYDLPKNPHNLISPGKRPLSSMTPAIVYNTEKPCSKRLVVGAANGNKIISGVAEVIINSMVFNLNLSYSIEKPRVHNQLYPDVTEHDKGVPADVIQYLKDRGQKEVKEVTGSKMNIVQAVMKNKDAIYAHSDSRKGGKAAIYLQKT